MVVFPGEVRREFEKLICVRSTRWWRDYDYWVIRQHRIMPVKTLHRVRPRHVDAAMQMLLPDAIHPWPMHALITGIKIGKTWKP